MLNGCGISIWSDKNVMELDIVMVSKHYEYKLNATELYTLVNMVHFI